MGINSEAHANHKQSIAKLKDEVALLDKGIAKETAAEEKADKEIASLAPKAANGDRGALADQRKLHDRRSENRIQRDNLEIIATPIRENIAAAERDLPAFVVAETKEALAEQMAALPALAAELSKTILPIATAFGDFRKQFDAVASQALSILGGDDPERIQRLGDQVRGCMVRGLRAQLSADFDRAGLHFLEVSKFENAGFTETVAPVLRSLISALGVDLPETDGSKKFRCMTNISGLMGLNVRLGEIVTLPVGDSLVQQFVADGSLIPLNVPREAA